MLQTDFCRNIVFVWLTKDFSTFPEKEDILKLFLFVLFIRSSDQEY